MQVRGEKKAGEAALLESGSLLRFAVANEPLAGVYFAALRRWGPVGQRAVVTAVPQGWTVAPSRYSDEMQTYHGEDLLFLRRFKLTRRERWLAISNGRFAARIDPQLLTRLLTKIQSDAILVNVDPGLVGGAERVRLTTAGHVAGFRRLYADSVEPAPLPYDWPHQVFIKSSAAGRLFADGLRPELFSNFLQRCRREAMQLRSIKVGGFILDLDTEQGLLDLLEDELAASPSDRRRENSKAHQQNRIQKNVRIAPSARIFGKVLFGQNVTVEDDAILAGPACLGDNVKVGQAATVRAAVLGTGVSVPRNSVLDNCILLAHPQQKQESERGITSLRPSARYLAYRAGASRNGFRTWPRFSYARCFKRVADITVALVILILFAPFLPLLALVIKLTSHGPVFFRDLRQGLHGRPFSCLKFRTMLVGADKMQDKLRTLNEADGPQFKMDGDPRTSVVGDFLRDTYIDEIPQFLNVLLGQMSVVGPRPSPESENTLCPPWRDARLSVRPGITGLWQVCRTRRPGKDFQEWIHYDTKYVTDLSFKMDLWIAWRTANKMLLSFARRF